MESLEMFKKVSGGVSKPFFKFIYLGAKVFSTAVLIVDTENK